MPDKPQNFWQELKRRKVIRVIIGYAAASYVILELTSIVAEPFGLPEWTLKLVFVLLCVGFIISIVISWLYDITPGGVQKTKAAKTSGKKEESPGPGRRGIKSSDIIIAVLLTAVIVLVYQKIFKRDKLEQFREKGEISIAVMPFQNMTGDDSTDYWQLMVQDNLVTSLSNAEELKVRQPESIISILQEEGSYSYASITPSIASSISKKLDASIFIDGSIARAGSLIRLNAKLVDSETGEVFKSFQIEGTKDNIFTIADSLSRLVNDYLIISVLKKQMTPEFRQYIGTTNAASAVRYYIKGKEAFYKRDYAFARELFRNALEVDTGFIQATGYLAIAYMNEGYYEDARKLCIEAYERKEQVNRRTQYLIDWLYANYFHGPAEALKPLRQLLKMDEQQAFIHYLAGLTYTDQQYYDKAIPEFERSLSIYDQWEVTPPWVHSYTSLGEAYNKTGQYGKEKKLYRKAEKEFPGDIAILSNKAVLALKTDKSKTADECIEKYISALKEMSYSESAIARNLGSIYLDAGMIQKAEEKYRDALSMQPGNASFMNNLAYLLIDKEINIEEGLELAGKALRSEPENYLYLDTKGWGLYRQGKYEEALNYIKKSWELKPIYNHVVFLHLEAAKEAVDRNENYSR